MQGGEELFQAYSLLNYIHTLQLESHTLEHVTHVLIIKDHP